VVGVSTAVNALAWGVILGVALALTGQVTSLGQYYLVQAGGGLGGAIGPLPRRLALRRHRELPAGVHGRLCCGRGLGRCFVVRGTAHARDTGRL
jgi:hypothetical protein